jgi:CheY-like chemotaxis protein
MDITNILLAEDDLDDYHFFIEALEKVCPSCYVTRVKNGLDCVTLLKAQPVPSLIFLDLNIPMISGIECLKFVKSTDALSGIPVVVYSTSHYIKDIDAAFKNGAHYYIVKPCNEDELVEILTTVLSRLEESSKTPTKENFVVRKVVTLQT